MNIRDLEDRIEGALRALSTSGAGPYSVRLYGQRELAKVLAALIKQAVREGVE